MVRVGDGVENGHKRRAYERNSISHVNNVHLEYGKCCLQKTYKHIFKAPGAFKCGKGPRGIVKSLCPCMCMQHRDECASD